MQRGRKISNVLSIRPASPADPLTPPTILRLGLGGNRCWFMMVNEGEKSRWNQAVVRPRDGGPGNLPGDGRAGGIRVRAAPPLRSGAILL